MRLKSRNSINQNEIQRQIIRTHKNWLIILDLVDSPETSTHRRVYLCTYKNCFFYIYISIHLSTIEIYYKNVSRNKKKFFGKSVTLMCKVVYYLLNTIYFFRTVLRCLNLGHPKTPIVFFFFS